MTTVLLKIIDRGKKSRKGIIFDKMRTTIKANAWRSQGGIMKKMFLLGLALGMAGGALIVANSKKAKDLVDKGEESVKKMIKKTKKKSDKKNENEKDETEKQ